MNHARAGQTATLLPGGWVLVAGGGTATSEVYEPDAGIWVPTGGLGVVRTDQTATLLGDGDVLAAGGTGPDNEPLQTAEVYGTGPGPLVSLSSTSLTFATQTVGTTGNSLAVTVSNLGTAPLQVSGVGTAGADPADFDAVSECQAEPVAPGASCSVLVRFSPLSPGLRNATVTVFDNAPLSPQAVAVSGYGAGPYVWVPTTGSMSTPRDNFAAVALANGKVLVAGGQTIFDNTVNTAELYDPATESFSPTGSLVISVEFPATALLPDGDVLLAGGYSENESGAALVAGAELYNPTSGSWTPTGSLDEASDGLTATALDSGKVLVTGFTASTGPGSTPELYDPASGSFALTPPLPVAGEYGLVSKLQDGEVLLTNGPNGASALYDPATDAWTATGSLATAHNGGTATLLTSGEVLVVGGVTDAGTAVAAAELYDPATGAWSPTDSLPEGRWGQSAALLPNGSVVIAGGCTDQCDSDPSDAAKSYVYAQGFWSETGSLSSSRDGQSAVVLANGEVLLAGGEVNDSAAGSPTAELYITPLVEASPDHGASGNTVAVTGSGFYAHEVVTLTLEGATEKVMAQTKTGANGTFSVRATVPVVPAGAYQLQAQGQTSYASANTSFEVKSG